MTIVIDNQKLSVTDLFKKYDIDEISEILVKIKKEVFIRTNDIKKVIGSNPELMIDFGENVLNIYDASKKLNTSTFELLNDIESFSSSLGRRITNIIGQELPGKVFFEKFEIKEEEFEQVYFDILETFSNKDFIKSYEKYLQLKELLSNKTRVIDNDIFKNISFFKQGMKSNCSSYIQNCDDLTSKELSYLIIIRFLLELEDKELNEDNIYDIFYSNLKNAIILRVEENIENLEYTEKNNQKNKEMFYNSFILAMTSLITLYELKESLLNVISELKDKKWFNLIYNENFNSSLNILDNETHIENLKSVLLTQFEYLDKLIDDQDQSKFRYKILSNIYLNLFNIIENEKGLEILKNSLFPILISIIENDLLDFVIKDQDIQLLDLILKSDENESNSNLFKKHSLNENDTINWLNSRGNHFKFLLDELNNIQKMLDNIKINEKEQIIRNLSKKCFKCILNKFIEFNRNLFWSIKGRNTEQIPTIYFNGDNSLSEIHNFVNLLINGKQLDIVESYLLNYFFIEQKDTHFSFQSLLLDNQYNYNHINWKLLIKITHEILISITFSDNHNEEIEQESNSFQNTPLEPLRKLVKFYLSSEFLEVYINKLKTLEMLLYSMIIHTDKQNDIISLYQSILQPLINKDKSFYFKMNNYLSLCNLYRHIDSNDYYSLTPHSFLINFSINLNVIGIQMDSQEQKTDFNLICKHYFQLYIQPILINALDILIQNFQEFDQMMNNQDKQILQRIILSIYSDLFFSLKFNILGSKIYINDLTTKLISDYKQIISEKLKISDISHILTNIEQISSNINLEVQSYNIDENKSSSSIDPYFTSSTQRFSTLPLIKSSSIGTISNKIVVANDKILKANVDYNSISNLTYNHNNQYLLNQYSHLIQNYNQSKSQNTSSRSSSIITNDDSFPNTTNSSLIDDKINSWFSAVNQNSNTNTNNNLNNNNGIISINRKIDAQSIWQVSSLLKETVKDKVFGQRDEPQ